MNKHAHIVSVTEEHDPKTALETDRRRSRSFPAGMNWELQDGQVRLGLQKFSSSPSAPVCHLAAFFPLLTKVEVFQAGTVLAAKTSWQPALDTAVILVVSTIMISAGAVIFGRKVSAPQSGDVNSNYDDANEWWRLNGVGLLLAYGLLLSLMFFISIQFLNLLLASGGVALGITVTRLARSGMATRERVASLCCRWFFLALCFSHMVKYLPGQEGFLLKPTGIPLLLAAGAGGCALFIRTNSTVARRKRWWGVVGGLLLSMVFGASFAYPVKSSLGKLEGLCATFERDHLGGNMWKEWGAAAVWVKQQGGLLETTVVEKALIRMIDKQLIDDEALLATIRVGLLDASQIRELLAREEFQEDWERLLHAEQHPGIGARIGEDAWMVYGKIQVGLLTADERDNLEGFLYEYWSTLPGAFYLEEAALILELFEVIGRPLDISQERPEVWEQLEAHWVPSAWGLEKAGGFAISLESGAYSDLGATIAAVEIMGRFGPPSDVGLRQVRSYLVGEADPGILQFSQDWSEISAGVAIDKLDRRVGYPGLTAFGVIYSERLFIGLAFFVLLCFCAIWRAPVVI